MFDFNTMTNEELEIAISKINKELQTRKNGRRDELIEKVCEAMNTLYKEFPGVSLNFSVFCTRCNEEDDYDLLDYYCNDRPMTKENFTIMF